MARAAAYRLIRCPPARQSFVLAALDSSSKNIDSFLALMPSTTLDAARTQVVEENVLNEKEYENEDGSKEILNKPVSKTLAQP
jgi:hypothetical protein